MTATQPIIVPPDEVKAFVESLNRCLATPDFLEDFYSIFIESSDEVREKFKFTDRKQQARVLAQSLFALAVFAQRTTGSPAWGEFDRLASRHNRHDLDIQPELYDLWLACLLRAARSYDPLFSPKLENAWRHTLMLGIEYLRSRH